MVTRIKVRSNVVSGDDAVAGTLNIQHPLSGDTVVYPFGDRLWGDPQGAREIRLGAELLENFVQDGSCHEPVYIHRRFMDVNHWVIARQPIVDDATGMERRIPQPENYATFAAWVKAAVDYTDGNQRALAKAVGVSPQMITKYLNGRTAEIESLDKFAAWSGVPYVKLRLLMDGKPISEAKHIKDRINQTATPVGAQIGRQWEQISDERVRGIIAEQIRIAVEQQMKLDAASRKKTG